MYLLFSNPFGISRIWHKVNFKQTLRGLNSDFSFSKAGCQWKDKETVWPTIYQWLEIDKWNSYLSHDISHHHHHHVVALARISLTLSRHFSLSFIASGRSSGLHPVSSHRCCMYVRAGRPAFARPYVGVYRSTSLISSSLILQQCPACLVRLTWIVFVMGGSWPYS